MPIDHKDEYATLRQEVLKRDERAYDTAKFGVIGFLAILGFCYSRVDCVDYVFVLLILQLLIFLIGFTTIVHYCTIYTWGTYIAIVNEKGSKARLHRMHRQHSNYLKKQGKDKYWIKLRVWGNSPAMLSILIFFLPFLGFAAIFLKGGSWNVLLSDTAHKILFGFSCFVFILNMVLGYYLSFRMGKFRRKTEEEWIRYYKDFGTERFPDPYE